MNTRKGVTLMEVLVSIFVSAIGLLALLALFPLGALSMSQAIKDSRSAQGAANAAAIAEYQQVRNDPLIAMNGSNMFIFGNAKAAPSWQPLNSFPGYTGPGYPVYVDPTGFYSGYLSLGDNGVGGPSSPGFPRYKVSYVNSSADYLRYFTLMDDLNLGNNGSPGAPIQREGKFSWAYMLRRPNWAVANVVELAVVVYKSRSSFAKGESTYAVDWTAGTTTVTVPYYPPLGQEKPPVRNGSWVLDSTVQQFLVDPKGKPVLYPDVHGDFYRVVGVTDTTYQPAGVPPPPAVPAVVLDLQTPIKRSSSVTFPSQGSQGVLTVMENIAEVFNKGTGRQP